MKRPGPKILTLSSAWLPLKSPLPTPHFFQRISTAQRNHF